MNRVVKPQVILVFFIAFFLSFKLQAQKALALSKENRKIILNINKRVKYKLKDGFVDVGRIQSIGENSFTVNDREIQINEVSRIGRKGAGSNFFGIFLTSVGGISFLAAVSNLSDNNDPCPSCQGSTSTDSSVGPGIAATVAVAAVGVLILTRNRTKNISDWTLEIIDKPAK